MSIETRLPDQQTEKDTHQTVLQEWLESYQQLCELSLIYAQFPGNPDHISWPVNPFIRWLAMGFLSVSGKESRKYTGFTSQIGNDEAVPIEYLPEEIAEREYNQLLGGDPRLISIVKATHSWADLPDVNRIAAVMQRLQELFPQGMNAYGEQLYTVGNDVMQRVKGNKKYVDQVKLDPRAARVNPEREGFSYEQADRVEEGRLRVHAYQSLQQRIGVGSEFVDPQTGMITVELSSATTVYEVFSNLGAVKKNSSEFEIIPANEDILNAYIYGLHNAEHHVSEEVQNICLAIYNEHVFAQDSEQRAQQEKDFSWTPEKGFSLKTLYSVNGGYKSEHPLTMALLVKKIDGISKEEDSELFDKRLRRAIEIALGYPRECSELVARITARILAFEYPELAEEVGYHPSKDMTSQLEQLQPELEKVGVHITGVFEDLTADENTPVLTKNERIDQHLRLFEAVAKHLEGRLQRAA